MSQAVPHMDQMSVSANADQRRGRLVRSSLAMFAIGLGLLVVILFLRDTSRRKQRLAEFEQCRVWLETQWAELGRLPAKLGTGQGQEAEFSPNFFHYVDDATRYYAHQATEPLILVRSPMEHQWLGTSGRAIIVLENNRFHVEWVTEQDYNRRQAEQQARVRTALNPGADTEPKSPMNAPTNSS